MEIGKLTALKKSIVGTVVLPGDSAYKKLRNAFANAGKPAVIVQCLNNADVQKAIQFARDNALLLSVRGGGHNGAGFGTNIDGLVIDLSPMNSITVIDEQKNIVRIEGGTKWVSVADTLAAHGLAISSGDTKSVGVGGLMLMGGMGWMVRKYGLALDNLVAAEVVVANGEVLRASAEEHTDLFWAIRGGGGNFGVVTVFEVTAHPIRNVFFGIITYPATETAAVLKGWADYMRTATDDITTIANIAPAMGGTPPPLGITVCYAGDDADAAKRAIEPLLHIGTVLNQTIKKMPYEDV
ncbi:MAG: FAD-binding oxidoreductase, partial [Patescibacteria group bacterium]